MDNAIGCGCASLLGILILILAADDPSVWIYVLLGVAIPTALIWGIPKIIEWKDDQKFAKLQKETDELLKSTHELLGKTSTPSATYITSNTQTETTPSISNTSHMTDPDEAISVADEIIHYCQKLETDSAFRSELSKHNIEFNDINGDPLLGEGADVRRLFFIDIAHCYAKMSSIVDLNDYDGTAVLYLLCMLHSPDLMDNPTEEILDLIRETMADQMSDFVNAIADAPIFREDDDADFMVALVLLQYDHDEFCRYLTLLYRFCSLVAKADGHITTQEQTFLDHLTQLRGNTPRSYGNISTTSECDSKGNLDELDNLIGLDSVKQEVHTMSNFIKIQLSRQQNGLKTSPMSYHCVFTGNPGTGKTTVARIIAGIYAELGVISKGHLVETDRSGLVAEYEGQTAVKTNKVIDRAIGGVLFVDEAYSLITGDQTDFGKEAIATLLKRMEDDRDRLVVILAGYGDEMKQFIDSNPGLQSRFNRYIHFPDYTANELNQIFCSLTKKYDYELTAEASDKIFEILTDAVANKGKNFGNARYVRNLFEKTLERQANRLAKLNSPSLRQLKEISVEDC